jgi:integrase
MKTTVITVGNVSVPIDQWSDGRFWVHWTENGKQRKLPYKALEKAKAVARLVATRLAKNQPSLSDFTAAEREVFRTIEKIATAHGSTPLQAIDEWRAHRLTRTKVHLAGDVLRELLLSKQGHDLHGRYIRGLRDDLEPFVRAYPGDIRDQTPFQIETYLSSLSNVGPRRRNNVLSEIRHYQEFARIRGYMPDGVTPARVVSMIKVFGGSVSFYTPAVMQLFLDNVLPEWSPTLSIAGFSGVRTEEAALSKDHSARKDPLRWEDFDWDDREIAVRTETSKTGIPRRCPITDNLYALLQPWRDRGTRGPVAPIGKRYDREFGNGGRLVLAINAKLKGDLTGPCEKIEWFNDALRHSYGSYRMAIIKNMHTLAYEMGNSVAVIKRNYNHPRSVRDARTYFSLLPIGTASNIVQMPLLMA